MDALRIQLEDLFPDTCNNPERSTCEGEAAVEAQDEDPSSVEVDDFAGPMQVRTPLCTCRRLSLFVLGVYNFCWQNTILLSTVPLVSCACLACETT